MSIHYPGYVDQGRILPSVLASSSYNVVTTVNQYSTRAVSFVMVSRYGLLKYRLNVG